VAASHLSARSVRQRQVKRTIHWALLALVLPVALSLVQLGSWTLGLHGDSISPSGNKVLVLGLAILDGSLWVVAM
jgi:hypothetical protein